MNDKKELLNEIIEFLFECEILNTSVTAEEESKIEHGLIQPVFVEELIGILMNYVKSGKNTNYKATKALYLKLNDLRFDLEFARNEGMNASKPEYK
ncbi:MAG: hypothetical protein LBJ11_00490 [Oscillospiraceae bacterium]|jgi:hypothetical protein|nr:hypothetical protein [Oscillospiraceae bacterium]